MSSGVETSLDGILKRATRLQLLGLYHYESQSLSSLHRRDHRLSRRTWEHREGARVGFSAKYQCKKLIYYEHYRDIRDAIARESQLKKWSRAKKLGLINQLNPRWEDLGADVLQDR